MYLLPSARYEVCRSTRDSPSFPVDPSDPCLLLQLGWETDLTNWTQAPSTWQYMFHYTNTRNFFASLLMQSEKKDHSAFPLQLPINFQCGIKKINGQTI